ncbi:hypothetical protein CIPAW_09G153300 [Carya illinoinensis]|uniref:Uncharacterized protein n=1 Tax=Carya illinoinensis TaxID=32201 RepID=A0A8T1PLB1_CARIL|nr:hypothetical protein CIPAW_09G153300 [Carya illinoinensis]KAG6696545.1 hypothetical protein I3842_09G153000 [Carya illinoinensis]
MIVYGARPINSIKRWFLAPTANLSCFGVQHAKKLEVCRNILRNVVAEEAEDPSEGSMIDAVQRLNIDYHFQEEIESILRRQYVRYITHGDLHVVALRFRLLRQQAYYVAPDVFNKFKDAEGIFNKELSEDIDGLMALYEASHLNIEGEEVLDEAGKIVITSIMPELLEKTLGHPYHKSLASFTAKEFFDNSQCSSGRLNDLLQLAKMDFNMTQSMHQKEIAQISKWWGDLGLAKELKFARNQPLKWYICSMVYSVDPDLSNERVELTKPISLIYIIDNIFDVHGMLEELALFTEAINKWDFGALDQLPEYMKICFKALYDITDEICQKIDQKHGSNPLDSLRKMWASLCNAFLVEAQWFALGQSPNSGVHVVLVHTFFLLGQRITKETEDLVENMPDIISFPATILRLWDDLGSAMDESQDGRDGSYIEYYMKEHQDCSIKEARKKVLNLISNAWKCLNKECLSPNPFSASFTKASLNIARMVPLLYNYDENHGLPSLEEHVKLVLYESVSV